MQLYIRVKHGRKLITPPSLESRRFCWNTSPLATGELLPDTSTLQPCPRMNAQTQAPVTVSCTQVMLVSVALDVHLELSNKNRGFNDSRTLRSMQRYSCICCHWRGKNPQSCNALERVIALKFIWPVKLSGEMNTTKEKYCLNTLGWLGKCVKCQLLQTTLIWHVLKPLQDLALFVTRRTTDWRWNARVHAVTSIGVGCSTQRVVAAVVRTPVSDQYCIGPV